VLDKVTLNLLIFYWRILRANKEHDIKFGRLLRRKKTIKLKCMFNEQFYKPKGKEKLFRNNQSNYFEHYLFYLLDEEGLSGEEVCRVFELILRSESKPIILISSWYELLMQHFPNLRMILLYD
jgi:hypothetical protein